MIRSIGALLILGATAIIFGLALAQWTTQDLGRPPGLTERLDQYERVLHD